MNELIKSAKKELKKFKAERLHPMYIQGRLGAQYVYPYENKCVTSFSVCDNPENITENLQKISKLLDMCEGEDERRMIGDLKILYMKFISIYKQNYNQDFENKLDEIHYMELEFDNIKNLKYYHKDIFEDYISILEGLQRYKNRFRKNFDKPIFNSKTFDFDNTIKELKLINYSKFNNMNLFYNIISIEV